MIRRLVVGLGCLLAIAGCDGGEVEDPDAGRVETDSGGGTDAGMITLETLRTPVGPANFDCERTAPAGDGAPVDFNLVAESFGAPGTPTVEGLTVQFFADNIVPEDDACGAGCVELTTDGSGSVSASDVAGSWYAYRLPGGQGTAGGSPADFIPVVQYNEIAPAAGGSGNINAVAEATQGTIILLLGRQQQSGTGVVTGTVVDCDGNPVQNARVRAFDDVGEIELAGPRAGGMTAPFAFYFNSASSPVPAQLETDTNVNGLYGAGNIPVPDDRIVRIEISGALVDGGPETVVACEEVQVLPDGITIINVGPKRTDGPSCSDD